MKPELVLFDFDGTLADSYQLIDKAVPLLIEKYRLPPISPTEIERFRNQGIHEVISTLHIPLWKIPSIVRDFKKLFLESVSTIPIIPGIKEVLAVLHQQGAMLGILTGNSVDNVTAFLKRNNISEIHTIYGDVSLSGKTKKIDEVIKALQKNKKAVLYIGDEVRDIEAANQAHIVSVAVSWGLNSVSRLRQAKPAYIATAPQDILTIINKISGSST